MAVFQDFIEDNALFTSQLKGCLFGGKDQKQQQAVVVVARRHGDCERDCDCERGIHDTKEAGYEYGVLSITTLKNELKNLAPFGSDK